MKRARRRFGALLVTTTLLTLSPGCDDGKPYVDTSKREATVSGTVRVKGKPADGGNILFNASNSERIVEHRTAPINKDGSYTITAYTGGNVVTFDGEITVKNMGLSLIHEYVDVTPGTETKKDFDLMGGAPDDQKPTFPVPEKGAPRRK